MERYTTTLPNKVNVLNLDFTEDKEYGVEETHFGYVIDGEAIDRFAAYEDLGLLPEDIKKMDELYREKCEEVARLEKEIETLRATLKNTNHQTAVLCDSSELRTLVDEGIIDKRFCRKPYPTPIYVILSEDNRPSIDWMPNEENALHHMQNDGIEIMTFDKFYESFLREKEELEY